MSSFFTFSPFVAFVALIAFFALIAFILAFYILKRLQGYFEWMVFYGSGFEIGNHIKGVFIIIFIMTFSCKMLISIIISWSSIWIWCLCIWYFYWDIFNSIGIWNDCIRAVLKILHSKLLWIKSLFNINSILLIFLMDLFKLIHQSLNYHYKYLKRQPRCPKGLSIK